MAAPSPVVVIEQNKHVPPAPQNDERREACGRSAKTKSVISIIFIASMLSFYHVLADGSGTKTSFQIVRRFKLSWNNRLGGSKKLSLSDKLTGNKKRHNCSIDYTCGGTSGQRVFSPAVYEPKCFSKCDNSCPLIQPFFPSQKRKHSICQFNLGNLRYFSGSRNRKFCRNNYHDYNKAMG